MYARVYSCIDGDDDDYDDENDDDNAVSPP